MFPIVITNACLCRTILCVMSPWDVIWTIWAMSWTENLWTWGLLRCYCSHLVLDIVYDLQAEFRSYKLVKIHLCNIMFDELHHNSCLLITFTNDILPPKLVPIMTSSCHVLHSSTCDLETDSIYKAASYHLDIPGLCIKCTYIWPFASSFVNISLSIAPNYSHWCSRYLSQVHLEAARYETAKYLCKILGESQCCTLLCLQ